MSEKKYNIIAVGSQEFVLGFNLAGIETRVIKNGNQEINSLFEDDDVGIVIIEDKLKNELNEVLTEKVEISVKPVFVELSTNDKGGDNLKKLIKKSLGIDLWKES